MPHPTPLPHHNRSNTQGLWVRGIKGGGTDSELVAIGIQAWPPESILLDWARLFGFSLATPLILALDHQGSEGKHLECSDGCGEPFPAHLVRPPRERVALQTQWKQ